MLVVKSRFVVLLLLIFSFRQLRTSLTFLISICLYFVITAGVGSIGSDHDFVWEM